MIDRVATSPAVHLAVALTCVLATGCACVRHAPAEPVATPPPAASSAVAETPQVTAEPATLPPAVEPAGPAQLVTAGEATVPKTPVPVAPATPVAPTRQTPKPAPAATAAPAPTPTVVPKAAPAVPQPAAAPLDLKSLEARLRQTGAIGMLTKLSLKNQVDDLVDKFRAYHRRQGTTTLADLRRKYDMLFMKVLSLLQDNDPSLARDIVRSRSAIWGILEDPKKFTESRLMAGATP